MMKQTGAREFKTNRFDGNIRELSLYQRYLGRELKAMNGAFLTGQDQYPPYLSNDIAFKLANGTPLNPFETKDLREHRAECQTRQTTAEKGIALLRNSSTDAVFEKFLAVEQDDRYNSIEKCRFMLGILERSYRGSQRQQNLIIESIKKEAEVYCKPANSPKEAETRLECLKTKEQELLYFANGVARFSREEIERKIITILDDVQFITATTRINHSNFQNVGEVLQIFKDEMAASRGYSEGKTAREHSMEETTAPFSLQSSSSSPSPTQSSASSSPTISATTTQPNDDLRRVNEELRRDLDKMRRERATSPSRSDNWRPRDDGNRQWRRSPSREGRDDRRARPHWTEDRARRSPSQDSDQQFRQWQQFQFQQFQNMQRRDGQDRRPPPPDRSGSPHPRREDGGRPQYFSNKR